MKIKLLVSIVTIALSAGLIKPAQAQGSTEQVKTLFVFNFTRYIQWPQQMSEVTIGVLGNDDKILAAFKEMAEKKSSSSMKIVVKQFTNPAEASNFHMVYIPENNSQAIKQLAATQNTLVITEKAGMAQQGSFINFITENGKIRFEINKSRVDNSNLKISGQLMGLAIIV